MALRVILDRTKRLKLAPAFAGGRRPAFFQHRAHLVAQPAQLGRAGADAVARDDGGRGLAERASARFDADIVDATVDRTGLWEAQTPQVFRRDLLNKAYAARSARPATDDAELVERIGAPVTLIEGSAMNIKITAKDDLRLAEQILKVLPKAKPEGFTHPFAGDDMWR